MKVSRRKSVYTICAILLLLVSGNAFGADDPSDLLPAGLVMEDEFKPGPGAPVGKFEIVEGEVVIIHAGELSGYSAQKDLPLFTGDTIVALETGRTRFRLNDGSVLTLASETKLVINRSVFDPAKKTRSSYFGMSLGKARFWVTKLADFKKSKFKVKTNTGVCGVRGSDFIVIATATRTEIIALAKTLLEAFSLYFPEGKPISAKDFERIIMGEGELPWKEEVSPEEIEELMKLFEFILGMVGPLDEEQTLEEIEELLLDILDQLHYDVMTLEDIEEGLPELPPFPGPPEPEEYVPPS
jgi:hypothetical protein